MEASVVHFHRANSRGWRLAIPRMRSTAFLSPSCRPPDASCPFWVDLIGRAWGADVPVIYANDDFGVWRSHHRELVDTALAGRHADLSEPIKPDDDSLFVVKARHSIFYETLLSYLLSQLQVRHVVLCGQVTEQCVLYSALDAHLRHLTVTVPQDARTGCRGRAVQTRLDWFRARPGGRGQDGGGKG
jgi:nicotinamidase-related amidase